MSYKAIYFATNDSMFGYYEPSSHEIDDAALIDEARDHIESMGMEFNTPLVIDDDGIQGYPLGYLPALHDLKFNGSVIYYTLKNL